MEKWSNIEIADLQVLTDEELREVVAFFSTRQEPLSQREVDVLSEARDNRALLDSCVSTEHEDDNYNESMDGDHESALASAGWGTDEDYGYYGGEDW
jgi:hypothetical protein